MTATLEATTTAITEPGVFDIDDVTYHADPVPDGSLSSSGARKLLPPSCPALFQYERENPPASTKTFDFGHAAHKLCLGVGPDIVEVVAENWRTNAAKDCGEEIRAAGGVPLLTGDYQQVQAMAAALRAHPVASALFTEGTAEASLFWTDKQTGVWRRSRLDWLPASTSGRMIVPDYKTARSADPEQFVKSAKDYGYHQQHAWYLDAVTALELTDDPQFVFVVQEKTPPYLVSLVQLDMTAMRIGQRLNRRAINIYAECTRTGVWPGYADDVALVSLPYWYERQFEGDS